MDCDRCGREIEGGALVGIGARRFQNLCRACWLLETRSSNSRLISALNAMTRGVGADASAVTSGTEATPPAGPEAEPERRRRVEERRQDPERPHWHP